MSIWNKKLAEFRDELASAAPTPGGGSAAMVGAALGCGLLLMAAEIGAARADAAEELKAAIPPLRKLLQKLSAHADRDIDAYAAYVAARKLPAGTAEEKDRRDAALNLALREAAEAPAASAEDALQALALALPLAETVQLGVLPDVGAGAALLGGGVEAALYTLNSNIRLMKDREMIHEFTALRNSAHSELRNFRAAIEERIGARLAVQ